MGIRRTDEKAGYGCLKKYTEYDAVIVVCHGTIMQYVLDIKHPENGQIQEFIYE